MSTLTATRQAATGIAAVLVLVGVAALVLAMVAPQFVNAFAANATPIVTGETSLVSTVIAEQDSSIGLKVED